MHAVSRRPRRLAGSALAVALAAVVPLAAACDAGQNAETKREQFGTGSVYSFGSLKIQDVQLHPLGGQTAINGTAAVTFSVFDEGQTGATLTSISTEFGGSVTGGAPSASASASASASVAPSAVPSASASQASSASLPLSIPAGGGLAVGPGGNAQLTLTGLGQTLAIGQTVNIVFSFGNDGATQAFPVPVTEFVGVSPSAEPSSPPPTSYPPVEVNQSYTAPPYDDEG